MPGGECDGTKSYLSLPIMIIGILSYLELSYLMWNSFLLISRLQHSAPLHATNMSTLPDSFLVSIPVPSNCKYYCVFICISYTVCVWYLLRCIYEQFFMHLSIYTLVCTTIGRHVFSWSISKSNHTYSKLYLCNFITLLTHELYDT